MAPKNKRIVPRNFKAYDDTQTKEMLRQMRKGLSPYELMLDAFKKMKQKFKKNSNTYPPALRELLRQLIESIGKTADELGKARKDWNKLKKDLKKLDKLRKKKNAPKRKPNSRLVGQNSGRSGQFEPKEQEFPDGSWQPPNFNFGEEEQHQPQWDDPDSNKWVGKNKSPKKPEPGPGPEPKNRPGSTPKNKPAPTPKTKSEPKGKWIYEGGSGDPDDDDDNPEIDPHGTEREDEPTPKNKQKRKDKEGIAPPGAKPSNIDGENGGALPPGIMAILGEWAQLDTLPPIYLSELIARGGDPNDPNPDGTYGDFGKITAEDVFNRTLGPRIRPTNPNLGNDFTGDLSTEEVLHIAFGAAPIDPMSPEHENAASGGGGMPVSPNDPGVSGTPSAFARGQAKTSALYQMEDEW